jgi:uncharacterized protein YcbK (DUF882 family)
MQQGNSLNRTRRHFLGFVGASAALVATPLASASPPTQQGVRSLSLRNLHTGEHLKADFWIDGRYQPDALAAIDAILRDHRSDKAFEMDRGLLDVLHRLATRLETRKSMEIISGYRAPETNAMLRANSKGVAKSSYHTRGMAADIRLADRPLGDLYKAALAMKAGGVGYYSRSRFVHVDVGPVRTWGGKPKA